MRNFAIIIIMLFFINIHSAFAGLQAQQNIKFSEWMSYFYLNKDLSQMDDFLQWLQNSKILENNHSQGYVIGFLTVIFANNPTLVPSWSKVMTYTDKSKEVIKKALWLSGNDKIIAEVFNEPSTKAKSSSLSILNLTVKNAEDLDMMWGAFSASGDVAYVNKIIDALGENTALSEKQSIDVTRDAAAWSLGSNMMQHELVNRLIFKEINIRSGVIKTQLENIAKHYNKKNSFPHHDGDFSAMMIITDMQALNEYKKPPTETVRVNEISNVKPGDSAVVKIAFTGMQLTEDLLANVTFNLKLVGPDGKIMENPEWKNLKGLETKIPTRFRIYHNPDDIMIGFDQNDPLGKYKFLAEVYDHVGGKKILLTKEIELSLEPHQPMLTDDKTSPQLREISRTIKASSLGPVKISLIDQATIIIPKNYVFIPKDLAFPLYGLTNQHPGLLGFILPNNFQNETTDAILVVTFNKVINIKRYEAKNFNPEGLLEFLQNDISKQIPSLKITGWVEPPIHDESRHTFIYSLLIKATVANQSTEREFYYMDALGQEGCFSLIFQTAIHSTKLQNKIIANEILSSLQFNEDKKYDKFKMFWFNIKNFWGL